ncbi:fibronectin type III domain-containing protein [Patescibacteria group bacterium]|nr:fibronectin type III domain-containing protein [Patescibacteria group bacterium]
MKKILAYALASLLALPLYATTALAAGEMLEELDVTDVTATAYDSAIRLEWTAPEYDGEIAGYQVWYDTTPIDEGTEYGNVQDVGNVTSYTLTDLENGTAYYFSVTAYDAEGNESFNWTYPEPSATPMADAGEFEDVDPPQVYEAEALNKEEVKVVFTEAVVLPEDYPENAFYVEDMETIEPLRVIDAQVDEEDETGETVILLTDPQTPGNNYSVTVNIDVTDKAGNPIVSGTADFDVFEGSDLERPENGPEVMDAEVIDETHVLVSFDKAVLLDVDPAVNFVITEEDDDLVSLEIMEVSLEVNADGLEDGAVLITTSEQGDVNYMLTVSELYDADGFVVNPEKNTFVFAGGGMSMGGDDDDDDDVIDGDVPTPKDVANFMAKKFYEAEQWRVELSWNVPSDNVGLIMEQVLYMSENKGEDYKVKASLEPEVEEYTVEDLMAGEYWFKVTQKDDEGNETDGDIIKVVLSETGPGMAGLVLVSLGLGRVFRKKRV